MRVLPDKNKVIVEGINIAKKHQRPTRATTQGGIIDKDTPIHVSNVALICGTCGATRTGYRIDEAGKKTRSCRNGQGDVSSPPTRCRPPPTPSSVPATPTP